VLARTLQLAEQLETGQELRVAPLCQSQDERRLAQLTCPRRWGGSDDPVAMHAIAAVRIGDWLGQLDRLIRHLEEPVTEVGRTARSPRWS
jgi:hypothetical protein